MVGFGLDELYSRKKMNFTTDLPKKKPIVSYIVASAVKCEKYFPEAVEEGPVFRMHAVILTRRTKSGSDGSLNDLGVSP